MASKPAARTVTKYFAPIRARSTRRSLPPMTTSVAAAGSLRWQVEVAGDVVPRPGGDQPEPGLGVGDRLDGEVHHPVAAHDREGLHPVGDALAGEVEGLVAVSTDEVAHDVTGVTQARQHLLDDARPLALAGGGVGEQRDLRGHARSLVGGTGLSGVSQRRGDVVVPLVGPVRRPRRRSISRAISSESRTRTSIGIASISIEYGSVDGVATAAKMKVAEIDPRSVPPRALPETTPARLRSTTNRGISKATPKTSSIRVMKEKNSPNSVSWVSPAG